MSSNRNQHLQSEHDRVLSALVSVLEANNFSGIRADHLGEPYIQPVAIGEYIPDITASAPKVIVEVETSDSLHMQDSFDKWRAFSAHAQKHGCAFYVGVPKGGEQQAHQVLQEQQIFATVTSA